MPVTPKESKLARVQSILPQIECGNVYLPNGAAWLEEFIDECCKFPNGKHDDMVDAMSQALSKMLNEYTFMRKRRLKLFLLLCKQKMNIVGRGMLIGRYSFSFMYSYHYLYRV